MLVMIMEIMACHDDHSTLIMLRRRNGKLTTDMPWLGPRWKKGRDGKDFSALAAANPMSDNVAQLQASLRSSECTAVLTGCNGVLVRVLSRSAFGQPVEPAIGEASEERLLHFQVGPEEMFCIASPW